MLSLLFAGSSGPWVHTQSPPLLPFKGVQVGNFQLPF